MSDFKAKMHKIRFLLGQNRAPPQFPPRELTALPDLLGLAVFKRTTSEGRGKKQGRRRKGRGKGKERNEGGGQTPIFWLRTAPPELRPWTILSYLPSDSSSDAHDQSMESAVAEVEWSFPPQSIMWLSS